MGFKQGHTEPIHVDLLIVLATNRMDLATSNDFPPDLLERIDLKYPLLLPPLRERKEDIPALVQYFTRLCEERYATDRNTWQNREIDHEVNKMLSEHVWPDNIRGLASTIDRAIRTRSEHRRLTCDHIKMETVKVDQPDVEARRTDGPKTKAWPGVSDLLSKLESFQFETAPEKRGKLADALPSLKAAYSRCAANMLRTALIATSKFTPKHPEGEIQITNAIELLWTDLSSLPKNRKTQVAADEIKRLYSQAPEVVQHYWQNDKILLEAYETALKQRPKPRSSKSPNK